MKTFLSLFLISLFSFGLVAHDADAKRFGGGGNIGKQRSAPISREAPKQTQNAAPAPVQQPKPSFMGRWGGMLAGLGLGALIGSMIGGNLGAGVGMILNLLLIAGVIYLVYRFFIARKRPGMQRMQYAGPANVSPRPEPVYQGGGQVYDAPAKVIEPSANVPSDFDAKAFIRQAELAFVRLQAANDAKDLNDIREYTTPEMFAEISQQMRERGDVAQQTEVVSLNAQILEVVREDPYTIASVRYSGLIRENDNSNPEAFDEVWHVRRDETDRSGAWLISGIQQTS